MSFMRSYDTLKYWLELSFLWISASSVGVEEDDATPPELGAEVPIDEDDDDSPLAPADEWPDGTSRETSGTKKLPAAKPTPSAATPTRAI